MKLRLNENVVSFSYYEIVNEVAIRRSLEINKQLFIDKQTPVIVQKIYHSKHHLQSL